MLIWVCSLWKRFSQKFIKTFIGTSSSFGGGGGGDGGSPDVGTGLTCDILNDAMKCAGGCADIAYEALKFAIAGPSLKKVMNSNYVSISDVIHAKKKIKELNDIYNCIKNCKALYDDIPSKFYQEAEKVENSYQKIELQCIANVLPIGYGWISWTNNAAQM